MCVCACVSACARLAALRVSGSTGGGSADVWCSVTCNIIAYRAYACTAFVESDALHVIHVSKGVKELKVLYEIKLGVLVGVHRRKIVHTALAHNWSTHRE